MFYLVADLYTVSGRQCFCSILVIVSILTEFSTILQQPVLLQAIPNKRVLKHQHDFHLAKMHCRLNLGEIYFTSLEQPGQARQVRQNAVEQLLINDKVDVLVLSSRLVGEGVTRVDTETETSGEVEARKCLAEVDLKVECLLDDMTKIVILMRLVIFTYTYCFECVDYKLKISFLYLLA